LLSSPGGAPGSDRPRIELANSLLFTLPGSPVIYYGDEIGMGDNIWLEDRDGVRTPMQWDAGPNAGFSTADASALYNPLIDDPVHGYRRVNVAAQRADPGSLLNRMREMMRVRKAHAALGRGEIRFLTDASRVVMAYLRVHGDETLLVINNLSSEPTVAELDLGIWADRQPVDLFTGERLAAIAPTPYRLGLERYGYRWLQLSDLADKR
jgi:maltose alpha-D-glucosyltransferase/alpha-amylase